MLTVLFPFGRLWPRRTTESESFRCDSHRIARRRARLCPRLRPPDKDVAPERQKLYPTLFLPASLSLSISSRLFSPLFPFQFPILKRKTIGTVFPSPTCSHSTTISLAEPLVVALSSFAFPDNPDSSLSNRSPFPFTDYAGGDDTQQKEVRWTDGRMDGKKPSNGLYTHTHTHTEQYTKQRKLKEGSLRFPGHNNTSTPFPGGVGRGELLYKAVSLPICTLNRKEGKKELRKE